VWEKKTYLLAGYPWFGARARDQFFSLPGCTLTVDRMDYFDAIMKTSVEEIGKFLAGNAEDIGLEEIDQPDALLWFIAAVQQYAAHATIEEAAERFGEICAEIIDFIRKQNHPNIILHNNNLLYINGTERALTWMNAVEDNLAHHAPNGICCRNQCTLVQCFEVCGYFKTSFRK